MPILIMKGMRERLLNARTGTGDSEVYALPVGAKSLSWQTSFDVAPAAVSITVRTSLDNSLWTILDTTTAVGGELRTKELFGERFVKINVGTNTGDRAVTAYLNVN
jgi:hypothetical protein